VSTGQAACFAAGIAVLAMALLSPLDALAGALFAAHMAQHLLLILVAAPLLALAAPAAPLLWGLPAAPRRGVVRAWPRWLRRPLRDPAFAWVLHTAVLWGWHLPPLYQAALRSGPLHALEHASFLATALPYWAVLVRLARPDATRQGVGVVYAFLAMLQSGVLGALITLSAAPWYPLHAETTAAWGLTPLEDQQLAGLVMWVPASLVYLAAGLALTLRWLAAVEAADRRREERAGLPRP
jgi:putative membrane protein